MRAHLVILIITGITTSAWAQGSPEPLGEALQLRDPFKRPKVAANDDRPRTELEQFSVDQYKFLGILTGPEKTRAMLLGPNGKTYFISEKMKIGVRKGVVRKITGQTVIIRERIVNVLGREENIDTELHLPGDHRGSGT